MASNKTQASTALLLSLNLLFFTLVVPSNCLPPPPPAASCPRDTLKLGVCADVLGELINVKIGKQPKTPCCSLLEGLADLEAAVCFCTALNADILGIHLNVPVSLSLLHNHCGKNLPAGYKCAQIEFFALLLN